ncbi:MAG: LPS-assembly protein LptD [Thermoanaerobaculia bacterium]
MSPDVSSSRATVFVLVLFSAGGLAGQLTQNSFDQSDPFSSRFKEKSHFEIKMKPVKAGGPVKIKALKENCHEGLNVCVAEGEVVVEYQDVRIQADKLTYDRRTNLAEAEGHVVIDQGATRMAGSSATFDLNAKTGTLHEAEADLEPTFHVIARTISKVGEDTYEIEDGIFTACAVPNPSWSFAMKKARITLDEYARMKNVSFRAGPVPLLFTPYLLWPTKEGRVSGFLVPGLGFNSTRGAFLGLTYYWVTGRSTDLTSELDLYSKGVVGLGEEFRWAPSSESAGVFQGFVLRDNQAEVCVPGSSADFTKFCNLPSGGSGVLVTSAQAQTRWKIRLDHSSSDLPWDIRGVLSIRDYSDPNYLQDFERSYALNSARQIVSTGFLTKNLGDDSLNLRLERSETFFSSDVLLERTPSLEFSHRTARIGETPLYAALDASFSRLFVNRGPNAPHGGYDRADFHPILSLPLKNIPWLSLTARLGGRVTEYTDSVTPLTGTGQSFAGRSLLRAYSEASASLVGPSFSRIYDFSLGPFARWKHILEPRVDYNYVADVRFSPNRDCSGTAAGSECPQNTLANVPLFDEVDSIFGQNSVTYRLVNRLLAKAGGENAPAAQEVATLDVSQTYNFRYPQTAVSPGQTITLPPRSGPIQGVLRIAPAPAFHLDAQVAYDTTVSRATSFSFAAGANWKNEYANLTWTASRPTLTTPPGPPPPAGYPVISPNSDFLRASVGINLFTPKLRLDTLLNYDAQLKQVTEDRSLLTFNGSCYTILLEVRNLRVPVSRHDYRLVINLKNIGTLLDLNGGLDKIF